MQSRNITARSLIFAPSRCVPPPLLVTPLTGLSKQRPPVGDGAIDRSL